MSSELWNVPETPEGRERLRDLIEKYRSAGKKRELGISLTRMASMVKQIGEKDGENAWDACVEFGREAIEVLRQTDDKSALADALSGSFVYLIPKEERAALCRESLALAKEQGNAKREGWATFALAMLGYPREMHWEGYSMEDAVACFERAGDMEGKATCLQIMGAGRENGRWRKNLEAAKFFEQAKAFKRAAQAYSFAAFWGSEDTTPVEAEEYLLAGVQLATEGEELNMQAALYGQLKSLWNEAGEPEKANRYRELEDSLDVPLYGSRANRLRHDLEIERDLLACHSGKDKREAFRRIKKLEDELVRLGEH